MATHRIWNPAAECMPREQLRALQLERLKNVVRRRIRQGAAVIAAAWTEKGIKPEDIRSLDDCSIYPLCEERNLQRRNIPNRHVCRAAQGNRCVCRGLRERRQADFGGLHAERFGELVGNDGAHDRRGQRHGGRYRASGVWIRPVHRGMARTRARRSWARWSSPCRAATRPNRS